MTLFRRFVLALVAATVLSGVAVVVAPAAYAQSPEPPAGPVVLTLDAAIEIALERAYAIRLARLDTETARSQVREAYGGLLPRVDATSQFSRNVVQANPFAGSSAGNLFSGLGAIGWLAFNEDARTDDDPATVPISLAEYNRRVSEGQSAAGFVPGDGSSNPFGTDNQFTNTLSLTQPIYSGTAFAAVRGARSLVDINEAAVAQREDETIDQTRQAFYGALLAEQQAAVQRASLERSRETFGEASQLVAQGVRPVLERLNAEVDLANAGTAVVTAEASAETARDQLLLTLGLPVDSDVVLVGELAPPAAGLFQTVGLAAASARALDQRPDVQQATLAVRLNEVQRDITKAGLFPSLSAFVNAGYNGNVPDDRSFLTNPDPADPFTFESGSTGFFSDSYWNPSLTVGLRLNWMIFDGFQTNRRIQQNQIAVDQAAIQLEQARNAAQLEVASAVRQLESARRRLEAQSRTVSTAETAFAFASARLSEGVASQLDVRVSSQNLDLARLNYLQAVYDALVARSAYERATGTIAPTALDTVPPAETPTVISPVTTIGSD
ncbi:TolC family protein [Rubrivirga sp. IMCC43871]|uniref:TolC family protein n=1 Tax=Rubrivirga sp. IMCC43871 TaxID=3391575 RepID=UPI0039902F26